jgi:hypothetical protein
LTEIMYFTQGAEYNYFPMEWLFSWEVTSVVVVAFLATAFAFLALDDFKLAKLCFLVAAADAIGGMVMWGVKTQATSWARYVVVFIMVGSIGVLAVASLAYANRKSAAKSGKEALLANAAAEQSAPKLVSSIDYVYVAGNTKNVRTVDETLIILVVTIQNTGDPTTVADYRLEVDIPNRARPQFSLAKIPDILKVPSKTGKDKGFVFYATDFLPDKTFANPLTKDAPVRGIVSFVSTSVTPPELYKPGVGLSLIFKDVKGLYYKMTMPFPDPGKLMGQSFVGLRSGSAGK